MEAKFGLIGLAVMGQNLARNVADKKIPTVVYNRTTETMTKFVEEFGNEYLSGEAELEDFVTKMAKPRVIMIMVKAGEAVEEMIKKLTPLLDEGDVIVDGGNSHFIDTLRVGEYLNKKSVHLIGCGVSGGEEGALHGPSLMPGGDKEAYEVVKPIFEAIAAKDFGGQPCVTYVGDNAAGHYVKMVHNGIEYGVMQIIAEAYEMFRTLYKLEAPEIAKHFQEYNEGKLKSFLFEIAVPVLSKKDDQSNGYLVDKILDKAAQKGTGKWASEDALERGVPLPTVTEAVFARALSAQKDRRVKLSKLYTKSAQESLVSLEDFAASLEDALYAGILSTYAQGYDLIQTAAQEMNWKIDLAEISRIWEGGCIIRSEILNFLHKAFEKADKNTHLFEIPEVISRMNESVESLREIISLTSKNNIQNSGFSSALNYFQGMTSERTSANLIQGLRDYFGAHTYERTDQEGGFHTDWNG